MSARRTNALVVIAVLGATVGGAAVVTAVTDPVPKAPQA
mgnify:CR=1 FL=1